MSNRLFRAIIQFSNKRVTFLPHLALIQGNPRLLSQKLKNRQQTRQTERSIKNIAKIYGYSQQQIEAHKTYFCNLLRTPERQNNQTQNYVQNFCSRWFTKSKAQPQ